MKKMCDMNRIIDILMKRDGNTAREAQERFRNAQDMMEKCEYDPDESEEIMMSKLGLEMDYIMDFLSV